jgi:hypothetical protein
MDKLHTEFFRFFTFRVVLPITIIKVFSSIAIKLLKISHAARIMLNGRVFIYCRNTIIFNLTTYSVF